MNTEDGYKIEDKRRKYFFQVDNEIVSLESGYLKEIGPYGLMIYCIICSKSNDTNYVPSQSMISKFTGISRPTIIKAFNNLENLGLIKIIKTKNGHKNRIQLLDFKTCKNDLQVNKNAVNLVDSPVNLVYRYLSTRFTPNNNINNKINNNIKLEEKEKEVIRKFIVKKLKDSTPRTIKEVTEYIIEDKNLKSNMGVRAIELLEKQLCNLKKQGKLEF